MIYYALISFDKTDRIEASMLTKPNMFPLKIPQSPEAGSNTSSVNQSVTDSQEYCRRRTDDNTLQASCAGCVSSTIYNSLAMSTTVVVVVV